MPERKLVIIFIFDIYISKSLLYAYPTFLHSSVSIETLMLCRQKCDLLIYGRKMLEQNIFINNQLIINSDNEKKYHWSVYV